MPPEALLSARMVLAPATRLLRSRWPIHAIWAFNTQEHAPKPVMQGENVLITRPEYDPMPHVLPAGGGLFLSLAQEGQTVGAALEATSEAAPDFDFSALLSLLLTHCALIDLIPEEDP